MFLFIFLALPFAMMVLPWKAAWRVFAFVFFSFYFFISFIPEPDDDLGYVLVVGIIVLLVLISVFMLFLNFCFYLKLSKSRESFMKYSSGMIAFDVLLFGYFGFWSSTIFIKKLFLVLSGHHYGFDVHFFIAAVSITLSAPLFYCFLRFEKPLFKIIGGFVLSFLFTTALASILGAGYGYVVLYSAKTIAEDQPYCIALFAQKYRPAVSYEDFAFLTSEHSYLLVEQDGDIKPYHWSYYRGRFLPGINNWNNYNRPSVPCRPALNFSDSLPYRVTKMPEYFEIYFQGGFLKIPSVYNPRSFLHDSLSISASTPNFSAVPYKKGMLLFYVKIQDRKSIISDYENGKTRQSSLDLKDMVFPEDKRFFYTFEPSGDIQTVVTCYESREKELRCRHIFYRDGKMYSFEHGREYLPRWREMQQKLYELFASFGLK